MAPTIRVDEDVYDALKRRAEPFVDTPNSVLRRLLGLADQVGILGEPHFERTDPRPPELAPSAIRPRSRSASAKSRARKRRRKVRAKRRRVPRGLLVPDSEYEVPILEILEERGGRAPTREVVNTLEKRLGARLTEMDRQTTVSGETRWRSRAQFVRLRLVEAGEMLSDSPRGVWEISDKGRRRLSHLRITQ